LKTVGIVVGAAGIVGIGVGSYFGIQASSKNSDSKDGCTNNVCSPEGFKSRQDAQDAATVSTITFGVGAALLATGVVLYFVSPDASGDQALSLSARPRVGGAEFNLGGNW
jgi:serine/threonine-protein kinase